MERPEGGDSAGERAGGGGERLESGDGKVAALFGEEALGGIADPAVGVGEIGDELIWGMGGEARSGRADESVGDYAPDATLVEGLAELAGDILVTEPRG